MGVSSLAHLKYLSSLRVSLSLSPPSPPPPGDIGAAPPSGPSPQPLASLPAGTDTGTVMITDWEPMPLASWSPARGQADCGRGKVSALCLGGRRSRGAQHAGARGKQGGRWLSFSTCRGLHLLSPFTLSINVRTPIAQRRKFYPQETKQRAQDLGRYVGLALPSSLHCGPQW